MILQMMTIGEETGQLDELMDEMGTYYDKQVDIGIATMLSLIEPLFTIIIGLFAGLMIIYVALPMFNISNSMQ